MMRTTITLDDGLAEEARRYGVALSAAARFGIAEAVRRAKEAHDRAMYLQQPETDDGWSSLEAWAPTEAEASRASRVGYKPGRSASPS